MPRTLQDVRRTYHWWILTGLSCKKSKSTDEIWEQKFHEHTEATQIFFISFCPEFSLAVPVLISCSWWRLSPLKGAAPVLGHTLERLPNRSVYLPLIGWLVGSNMIDSSVEWLWLAAILAALTWEDLPFIASWLHNFIVTDLSEILVSQLCEIAKKFHTSANLTCGYNSFFIQKKNICTAAKLFYTFAKQNL